MVKYLNDRRFVLSVERPDREAIKHLLSIQGVGNSSVQPKADFRATGSDKWAIGRRHIPVAITFNRNGYIGYFDVEALWHGKKERYEVQGLGFKGQSSLFLRLVPDCVGQAVPLWDSEQDQCH